MWPKGKTATDDTDLMVKRILLTSSITICDNPLKSVSSAFHHIYWKKITDAALLGTETQALLKIAPSYSSIIIPWFQ
jgi:hypothetical protein